MKTWNQTLKQNIATLCLMTAVFFNPFGFDIVQYYLIQKLGDLWSANLSMYAIAAFFFGLYIILRYKNKND
jgi:hypothetical protein